MNDNNHDEINNADVSPLRGVSGLWFIPLVAIVVGAWMVIDHWSKQGPLIDITFSSADGLEQGKTKIKTRNVEVGKVEKITLNKDFNGVIVTVRMSKDVSSLLVEDAQFWVVQPRIGFTGVSGLGTLLSGQYIEFSPGTSDNRVDEFEGLEKPPLTPLGTPGLHLTLNADDEFSFSEGDPIHFQNLKVGKIENVYFNTTERVIYYNAFIEAPYHKLVTTNTRFWSTSGFRVELNDDGFSLQTGPLATVIQGGISFDVPDGEPLGERVTERAYYFVYPDHDAIYAKKYEHSIRYVVMVDGDVGGLNVGAPVIYRGLPIGKVQRIDHFKEGRNLLDKGMKIPVIIEINPGRLGLPDTENGKLKAQHEINEGIKRGLVATLESQNLLLGTQEIGLSYSDLPVVSDLDVFEGFMVIPTPTGSVASIADSIEGILAKLEALPIESIGDNVDQLLADGSTTMANLDRLLKSGEDVLVDVESQQLIKTLKNTLSEIEHLAQSFSGDSEVNLDIQRLLETAAQAFSELRPLLTELKNKPNALIFTGSQGPEPVPLRKEN